MSKGLTVINHNGQLLVDSREVAEMTEVRHADLLEKISGYVQYLENGKFRSMDFFIESSYTTEGSNKPYRCYLLTRKGCDMVANKMTGEKGVLFTAAYVTRFEEMEKTLNGTMQSKSRYLPTWDRVAISHIRFAREFAKAAGIRPERAVAVAIARAETETGKVLDDYRKLLPSTKEEDAEVLTSGQIGEHRPRRIASDALKNTLLSLSLTGSFKPRTSHPVKRWQRNPAPRP